MKTRKSKRLIALLLLPLLLFSTLTACKQNKKTEYTDAELMEMSADNLYDLLVENGLEIDKDLKENVSKKDLAEYIKADFDCLKQGFTSVSHTGYLKMANDIKEIYTKLTGRQKGD